MSNINQVWRLRVGLGIGALGFGVAGAFAFGLPINAQDEAQVAAIVPLTTPVFTDERHQISYDPFIDTVDGQRVARGGHSGAYLPGERGAGGGGASVGVPDIAYNQNAPTDGGEGSSPGAPVVNGPTPPVIPGVGQTGNVLVNGQPSRSGHLTPARGVGLFGAVLYVGRIDGLPPYAILRFSGGVEVPYQLGDVVLGQRIVAVTADQVKFQDGTILGFNPSAVSARSASSDGAVGGDAQAGPTRAKAERLNPSGAATMTSGGAGGGVAQPMQLTPSALNAAPTSQLPAPGDVQGGPAAENVGHVPLGVYPNGSANSTQPQSTPTPSTGN